MKFFDKNNWLNFLIGLTGFYFVFSMMQIVMNKFGFKVVAATPGVNHLTGHYYWLISFGIALILTLLALIVFCKPRAPFFVFLGILLGSAFALYYPLYITIVNLDSNVRKAGLVALYELLPHLLVVVGSLIALYVAWLSNRMGSSQNG
jgi:hypothetical protein